MDLINLLARLLSDTQVPRSLGALGVGNKSFDLIRKELKLFGYLSVQEIEEKLRERLSILPQVHKG